MSDKAESVVQLPRSVLKWMIVGLAVSSVVIIAISLSFGVTISQLSKISYLPFGLALMTSAAKLLLNATRFRIVSAGLSGVPPTDLRGAGTARIGSEFVALTTPSMSGGEFVRAAWLSTKGIGTGRALWIGYFEVIMDVYVSSAISLGAAWYAFTKGAILIASIIVGVTLPLVAGYTIVFLLPALRGVSVPRRIFDFVGKFIGEKRARHLESKAQETANGFSLGARLTLKRGSLPTVLTAVCITLLQGFLTALTLWFVFTSVGLRIDLIASLLASYGAQAVAALPISIGGSGIAELAVHSYLYSVYGFSSWTVVVLWRIASYQFVLLISGVAFMLLLRRAMKHVNSSRYLGGRVM